MKKGNIVFLTGVTSSGKTTLSRSLQDVLPEPYFYISFDSFTDDIAPLKFKKMDWPAVASQCFTMMLNTIKLFSNMGKNTIVDMAMLSVYKECLVSLNNYPVLFVHVTCSSIEELRRREKERGDRCIGQVEKQLKNLSSKNIYDVTVDTFENSIEECAEIINNLTCNTENFTSFRKMYEQL